MCGQESWIRGNLSKTPLTQLLFHIWKKEKTGCLKIKDARVEKSLCFKRGNVTLERRSFPGKDFLESLVEKKILAHWLSPLKPYYSWHGAFYFHRRKLCPDFFGLSSC